jgi:hypothetical protein
VVGGHTIEKHVGKSDSWLRNRLATDPKKISVASTFRNQTVANRTDGQFVKQNRAVIEKWIGSGESRPLVGEIRMPDPIGRVLVRGSSNSVETHTAEVIIVRDNSQQGWHILTSYPVPEQ